MPLAVATRGICAESVHYGSIAVVDAQGGLIAHAGDPKALTFTRSCLKPFQALALIAHAQVGRFDFSPQEVALMCASHSGEPGQIEAVFGILSKSNCSERDLQCGIHVPLGVQFGHQRLKPLRAYTAVHHNCSGKHSGMLALCRLLDASISAYLKIEHPAQQAILSAVAQISGVPSDAIVIGIDGCSAPNMALPLNGLARAYARLAAHASDSGYGPALSTIYRAMCQHPEMVSGEGRFDLALSRAGRGRWITKSGAEGVFGVSLEGRRWGIAIKIADGAPRALQVVAVETLRQLRQFHAPLSAELDCYSRSPILSARGIEIGEVNPIFRLG